MTFECHRAMQIDVERFVGDSHGTATQLDRFPVFAFDEFIMLKALAYASVELDRILGSRRRTGLDPTSNSLVKHANRTEFHRSRKLVTATRAGAFGLRAHGANRPSAAI